MQDLIMYIVLGYVLYKLVKAGVLHKLLAFVALTKQSAQSQGARGTVHSIVDGLFDNSQAIGNTVKGATSKVAGAAKQRAAGLRPQDYSYDPDTQELTLYVTKQLDLVVGRDEAGRFKAYTVTMFGDETRLTGRKFERYVGHLARKNQLSDQQAQALKDFMRQGRTQS